ncbi:hypothetical protein GCM10011354_18570 [Egicoccus halophilus]|uniref:Uncharacterized protein n=2 Tax=Egicoccus halophilus TaxID=1670830 RepID=A0A8J3EUP4_9ACTN|nr:hypothetical protein GCM10011354_18570 [Egicoccus halophilus]
MRDTEVDPPALRRALLELAPWLAGTEVGPAVVEAGDCDRCGGAPRLLPLCGPVSWTAVCRDCGLALGEDGWCDGHADQGAAARDWAAALPDTWPTLVLLWWLATGELRAIDPTARRRTDFEPLPAPVRAALGTAD